MDRYLIRATIALALTFLFATLVHADGSCAGPIHVVSATSEGTTIQVNLSNESPAEEEGYLILELFIGESQTTFNLAVSVAGNSSMTVTIAFEHSVELISATVCTDPSGESESPDPVTLTKHGGGKQGP